MLLRLYMTDCHFIDDEILFLELLSVNFRVINVLLVSRQNSYPIYDNSYRLWHRWCFFCFREIGGTLSNLAFRFHPFYRISSRNCDYIPRITLANDFTCNYLHLLLINFHAVARASRPTIVNCCSRVVGMPVIWSTTWCRGRNRDSINVLTSVLFILLSYRFKIMLF